jgi:hypothetical protein
MKDRVAWLSVWQESEHAVVADGEEDQGADGENRNDGMVQHPIQCRRKNALDNVIDAPIHEIPPIFSAQCAQL